ncbi:hypothetical protein C8R46DRAFT_1214682 [Mycena filopes]|nr:hypothetical protein C8R46DRAFT_1214682 [Mycena filopes]
MSFFVTLVSTTTLLLDPWRLGLSEESIIRELEDVLETAAAEIRRALGHQPTASIFLKNVTGRTTHALTSLNTPTRPVSAFTSP